MQLTLKRRHLLWACLLLLLIPASASAHVKWFSNFTFADLPLTLSEVITPTLLVLAALSFIALAVLVLIDRQLERFDWYHHFNAWFDERRQYSYLVMRIGLGATLLMSWQASSMLVPRLPIQAGWIGWFQFLLVLLLLFERTTPAAAVGTAFLYGLGFVFFGWFYMLDYLIFAGVAYYLLVAKARSVTVRGTALPALYFSVGFSLIWVGLEKLFYPQWGLYILQANPQLALGFPIDFFLVAAAFVEFVLGYLLIICLLERPLALLITLVFFTTTTIFGKVEVIGHTIIHAALVVFLLEGPGNIYRAPITFHQRTAMRMAFASVNFILLLAILMFPYTWGAHARYAHAAEEALAVAEETTLYAMEELEVPMVDFTVSYEPSTAWQMDLEVEGFEFVPPDEAEGVVIGEGHAYIYMDDRLIGIAYAPNYQLPGMDPGTKTFRVVLHASDGSTYIVDGEPIATERIVEIGEQAAEFVSSGPAVIARN